MLRELLASLMLLAFSCAHHALAQDQRAEASIRAIIAAQAAAWDAGDGTASTDEGCC